MTIAAPLVTAKANGAASGTTSGIDTTGVLSLTIQVSCSGAATVTDSKGNTWIERTAYTTTTPNIRFFDCLSPVVGTGHTFTVTASVVSFVVSGYAQALTYASQSIANGSSGTNGKFGNATFTPGGNNQLLLSVVGWPGATTSFTQGSGWTTIDSQAYVGGTSYGIGVTHQIQTTATAILTTDVPSSWTSSVSFTFGGIAYSEAVSAGITITTPLTKSARQRSGSTGSISITGTYTGSPTSIEASFNGGAYQTIVASPAGGTYSGTLTSQAAGSGTLTVRHTNNTAITATVADILIGDVFIVGGDSRSEGRGSSAQSYTHATLKSTVFRQDDAWAYANDAFDTGTSSGSHWPLLATQIMASTGVPVAFVSCGTGSTDLAGSHNEWAKNNSGYAEMTAQATASGVNSFKGVLMMLGPNAVVNASTLSQATYNAAIDTFAANVAADIAGSPKVLIDICGEVSTGSPPDRRAALDNIRAAIIEAAGDNSNVKLGPNLIEQDYSDGVHPQSTPDLTAVAKRWWLAIEQAFYSGTHGRGPRLALASWNAGRNQLTVVFDQALKTGLTFGTAAWKVSDNGTPMAVSSVAYHGSNTSALVITTSAAAVGGAGTTTLTFASGEDAKGLVVPLSADITMPSGSAIQIPAEPIYAAAVSEVDTTAPILSGLVGSQVTSTTADIVVTTDEGNGTLYVVLTTSATVPGTVAGAGFVAGTYAYSGSVTVSSTGAKTFNAVGLSPSTTYWPHAKQVDASGNDSAVLSGASFTTPSASGALSADEERDQYDKITAIYRLLGLDAGSPATVTTTAITAGAVVQSVTPTTGGYILQRVP